jgi:ribonuclease HI
MKTDTIIFCDGSSLGNPGPGGWGAIVSENGNVLELGGGERHTTNNKTELLAAINALKHIKDPKKDISVHTDSSYVINGMTKWIYGWQRNNWITSGKEPVSNRELWEELIKLSKGKKIKWTYVRGHAGIPGNERCDEIAVSYAEEKPVKLFKEKVSKYDIDLLNTRSSSGLKSKRSKNKGPAYSYLSLVNGKFKKHGTWAECEKAVKGIKGGVRFKKAVSAEDEKEIMREWGIK